MEKNLHKKHIKKLDLSLDQYDRITGPPLQVSVSVFTYGESRNVMNDYSLSRVLIPQVILQMVLRHI